MRLLYPIGERLLPSTIVRVPYSGSHRTRSINILLNRLLSLMQIFVGSMILDIWLFDYESIGLLNHPPTLHV